MSNMGEVILALIPHLQFCPIGKKNVLPMNTEFRITGLPDLIERLSRQNFFLMLNRPNLGIGLGLVEVVLDNVLNPCWDIDVLA